MFKALEHTFSLALPRELRKPSKRPEGARGRLVEPVTRSEAMTTTVPRNLA
jgi:hypothetical protein